MESASERRRAMRALSVFLSLLLLCMPVLAATGPDAEPDESGLEKDWVITLTVVGLVGVGLALLAIFTPDEADEEVIVSDSGDGGETVGEEALEAVEASRAAEEAEAGGVVEDDLFLEIEGD